MILTGAMHKNYIQLLRKIFTFFALKCSFRRLKFHIFAYCSYSNTVIFWSQETYNRRTRITFILLRWKNFLCVENENWIALLLISTHYFYIFYRTTYRGGQYHSNEDKTMGTGRVPVGEPYSVLFWAKAGRTARNHPIYCGRKTLTNCHYIQLYLIIWHNSGNGTNL